MSKSTSSDSNSDPNEFRLPTAEASLNQGGVCCAHLRSIATAALGLIAVIAIGVAAYLYGRNSSLESAQQLSVPFPPIHATASVTSEKYSMATGDVSEDAEGVFVLDHNSGVLVCSIIYPRVGSFMGQFMVNVKDKLGGGGKGGKYMMVTGRADFPMQSNNPIAPTLVYVLDTSTGAYACYSIPFSRQRENSRHPQQGALVWVAGGQANPVALRDSP